MVLAANGIILKRLSHKLRCYVPVAVVEQLLSGIALDRSKYGKALKSIRPTMTRIREMLREVATHFVSSRDRYWAGEWTLTSEVASIPEITAEGCGHVHCIGQAAHFVENNRLIDCQ